MQPNNKPEMHFSPPAADHPTPSKKYSSGRGLTILVIVSGVILLIAIATVVVLLMSRAAATNAAPQPADDAKNVKNVSFEPPATLLAAYTANNQSTNDLTRVFYYDDVTNCGLTAVVTKVDAAKSVKDTAVEAVNSNNAEGIATTKTADGKDYQLKDNSDQNKTYTFKSADLEQTVQVPGVAFSGQSLNVAYKQFGSKVAAISFGCSSDSWQAKKDELAQILQSFTLKTEK